MSRLLLLALLTHTVLASESCVMQVEKGRSDVIRVIEVDDSEESAESEIVAIHLPDRRKREVDNQDGKNNCKTDEDCGPGTICFARLICVKGAWRTIESLDAHAAN